MKIASLEFLTIDLPFRFSFGHSLASRHSSTNVIALATLIDKNGDKILGWGEGVPRDYVTGEKIEDAVQLLRDQYARVFLNRDFSSSLDLLGAIKKEFKNFGLESSPGGAAWCALELSLLDAAAKLERTQLTEMLGGAKRMHVENGIFYGGVIPFSGRRVYSSVLRFYKLAGFRTVKIKVGKDFDTELQKLALARKIMGEYARLRVDANCAWNVEETLTFAERARVFGLASIEQPLAPDDLEGLKRITSEIPEQVVADESLCTISQAKNLAQERIVSAFNIRVSKVGGILPALEIAQIARSHGIACHMGAQVGESGILSAAGRTFAAVSPLFENYEGSANRILLKSDLTRENLTFGLKGMGPLLKANGLGVTVIPQKLQQVSLPARRSSRPLPDAVNQPAIQNHV